MKVRIITLLVLVGLGSRAMATVLEPPSLRCASVNITGDVTLTWVVPPDPSNEFAQYDVYHSLTPGGPYTLIDTIIVYLQNTYLHLGAAANVGPQYYYLTTVSTSADTSITSDTLATIFLTVAQSTPLGSAVLDWNIQHAPPLVTADTTQGIQMEHPIGMWQQIGSVDPVAHHYSQVISICEDSLTYRIAVHNAEGCVSYSSLAGDVFADVTPPTSPIIANVSVDTTTNQTVITWNPSPEPDTQGYIIVYADPGPPPFNMIVDTVYGQNNTVYQWLSSNAGAGQESYTVAAFDTCYSGTPASPNTSATKPPHGTVFVSTQYNKCAAVITVNWTQYVGWIADHYLLYGRIGTGSWSLLGTFAPAAQTFTITNAQPFVDYCFVVKAVGTTPSRISLSNKACLATAYPAVPQWNYLRVATVAGENNVTIIDSVDLSAHVNGYRLERTFNGGPWQQIDQAPGGTGSTVVFSDVDVETDLRSYQYRVIVDDSCGTEVLTSNVGTSILLNAEPGLDGFNHLRWNGYVQWAGSVSGYAINRSIADGPYVLIAVNPPDQWEYSDNVSGQDLLATNGKFCYTIEALESGNPAGLNAISTSNVDCAIQQPEVWIPNAFIVGGYNHEFKPVIAFVDVKGYELTIINRWGQEIWTTNDPDVPWKGTVDGSYVPQGMYAYYCAFQNGAGRKYEERGTVTFLWGQE